MAFVRLSPVPLLAFLALPLALAGCGDDESPPGTDAGSEDASRRDTSTPPPDTGSMDATPADPCATDDPTSTVGCNGALLGAGQPDDGPFGRCVPDDTDQGSCTGAGSICYAFGADLEESTFGVCAPPCSPNGENYVNTGGCPTGSRCFAFDEGATFGFCFADCNAGTDCANGQCDGENACVGGEGAPMDGGVMDGGVMDGGVMDGGAVDGGAVDGGAMDGGRLPDAGMLPDAGRVDASRPDAGAVDAG